MTPENATLTGSLLLVAAAALGRWLLRDGTRLSNLLDGIDPCPDLSIGDH